METNFQGVGVALVTPFNDTFEIDFSALENVVEHVISGGVDYLVVLGTTAETPTLSREEKREVADKILAVNAGRLPVVVGIGGNHTRELVDHIYSFDFAGFDAILSVTPYYNKPTQEGIYMHYEQVANASPLPVILYNVPGRTGVNMTAETTLRLARDFKNILGVKEASGNLAQMSCILRDRPEGFKVISGDDALTLPFMAIGGDGIISVAANAFPEKFCRMVQFAEAGDFTAAGRLHRDMSEIFELIFAEGSPTGIKSALASMGMINNIVRLPLVSSSPRLKTKIEEQITKYLL